MSQLNVREATITQKSGFVYVEREGERVTLEVGDAIYESDLIVTGPNTTAEVQYVDGTTSRLAPDTQMRLVDFEFDASMNGENSFLVDIAEGAMRTVTGEIVKLNPDAFKVTTPRATVGIRGTDIATQINSDGSETHVVISIGKGHRVEITTHDGQLMSLYTAKEGVFIPVDLGGDIKPYIFNFTQEEIDNIIEHIQNALADENALEDDEIGNEDTHAAVIIDQSTVDILGSEVIETLTNTLESSGLEVLLPENVVLETEDEDVILVPGEPDGSDDVIDEFGYRVVSFDGQGSYYADGGDKILGAGGSFTASKTRINITQNITDQNTVVSGDVNNIISGTVQAADDIITGIDMSNGRIVGDAHIVRGGELKAGDDQITFDNKTGGTSIYGDAYSVESGAIAFCGDDMITIKNELTNSLISGDIHTLDGTVSQWGDDLIIIESDMTNSIGLPFIYGDSSTTTYNADGGNDTIEIRGTFDTSGGTSIFAGGGADSIFINNFVIGAIEANAGDDIINVTTFNDGNIDAGEGSDYIEIANANGGIVDGGDGADTIKIANIIGTVEVQNGYTSVDTLNIDGNGKLVLNGISSSSGFIVNNSSATSIDIMENFDVTVNSTSSANQNIKILDPGTPGIFTYSSSLTLNGSNNFNVDVVALSGSISGGSGNDTIKVTTFNSGGIYAGAGDDNITVDAINGSIDGGAGTDTLTVTSSDSHDISSTNGIENFVFKQVTTGNVVTGSINADIIHIENFTGGTLNTGDGNDTITIDNLTGTVALDPGDGFDKLEATLKGNVDIDINVSDGPDISDQVWEVPHLILESGVSGRVDINGWSYEGLKVTDTSGAVHNYSSSSNLQGTNVTLDGVTIYFNA